MAFTWVISQLDSIPTLDGMDKVISVIHWRAQKVHKEHLNYFTADQYGALSLNLPIESNFTTYNELSREIIESWLEAGLDTEAIEANLDAQIENFLNPPLVAYALPWSDPAKI